MLLRQDIDTIKFLQKVKTCHDEVIFETTEGDRLNLTSTLSQYVFCSIAGLMTAYVLGTFASQDRMPAG